MAFGSLVAFFFSLSTLFRQNENTDFLVRPNILPADKFAFRWSSHSSLDALACFVHRHSLCIAMAFVVYVDGGGHIYLSFSTYGARCYCCCHTTAFACTQRMYVHVGPTELELILLKSDSCSFSVCFAFGFVIVYILARKQSHRLWSLVRFSLTALVISIVARIASMMGNRWQSLWSIM